MEQRVQSGRIAQNRNTCLARSADQRPAILYVDAFDEGAVAVKPVPGWYDKPLWVPRGQVFETDPELYAALRAAYEAGSRDRQRKLWGRARRWEAAA